MDVIHTSSPAPPRAGTGPGMAQAGGRREVIVHAELVVAERTSGLDAMVLAAVEKLRRQNVWPHAEVVGGERRLPFELSVVEEFLRQTAWLRDIVRHLRWLQWATCRIATRAAEVLVDQNATAEARAEAEAVLQEFVLEDLHFSDDAVRRQFNRRELDRLDPFFGLPLWRTLIAELLSGRWRKCASDWPLFYLRYALVLQAERYYFEAVDDLRQRDAGHEPVEVLDRQPLPAWERKAEPKDRDQERLPRPTGPLFKPNQVPHVIARMIVEHDLAIVLGRVKGLPQDVGALIEHRVLADARDADLVETSGWSEAQLETAQTAWRNTWCSVVQDSFADPKAAYRLTPPQKEWKKWRKWRKSNFENPRQNWCREAPNHIGGTS